MVLCVVKGNTTHTYLHLFTLCGETPHSGYIKFLLGTRSVVCGLCSVIREPCGHPNKIEIEIGTAEGGPPHILNFGC